MAPVFPDTLENRIRDGRWTEKQLRVMGAVIVEFVLTLPLDKEIEGVCTRCLAALRSGDEAEMRTAAAAAYDAAYPRCSSPATAAATAAANAAANATYAANAAGAAAAANAAANAAGVATNATNAAYPRCSSPGKARIRKNFNFMIAQLALIVG